MGSGSGNAALPAPHPGRGGGPAGADHRPGAGVRPFRIARRGLTQTDSCQATPTFTHEGGTCFYAPNPPGFRRFFQR